VLCLHTVLRLLEGKNFSANTIQYPPPQNAANLLFFTWGFNDITPKKDSSSQNIKPSFGGPCQGCCGCYEVTGIPKATDKSVKDVSLEAISYPSSRLHWDFGGPRVTAVLGYSACLPCPSYLLIPAGKQDINLDPCSDSVWLFFCVIQYVYCPSA